MSRYAWSRLWPQQPPRATAFDTFLRPGAPAAPRAPQPAPKRPATDFRAFLKNAPAELPARDAASFASFLRKPAAADADSSAEVQADGEAEPPQAGAGPGPEQKVVCVLYGTEYGFSKEIAEKAAARLGDSGEYWCVWLFFSTFWSMCMAWHSPTCEPATAVDGHFTGMSGLHECMHAGRGCWTWQTWARGTQGCSLSRRCSWSAPPRCCAIGSSHVHAQVPDIRAVPCVQALPTKPVST